MEDDLQIIRRVLGGDVPAYRVLIERHEAAVFRLVRVAAWVLIFVPAS